ncbi:hypothetical protein F5B20DRAFT_597479 [Whalleya microplaca]|nr:hypothetical protein F5B20DRAFT_597479 [Whalleya microplaca]
MNFPEEDLRSRIQDRSELRDSLQRWWPDADDWLVPSAKGDHEKNLEGPSWGISALLVVIRHAYSAFVRSNAHLDMDYQDRVLSLAWVDLSDPFYDLVSQIDKLMANEFLDLAAGPRIPTFRSLIDHPAVRPLWRLAPARLYSGLALIRKKGSDEEWTPSEMAPEVEEGVCDILEWDGQHSIEDFVNSYFTGDAAEQDDKNGVRCEWEILFACNFPSVIRVRYDSSRLSPYDTKGFDDIRTFTLETEAWVKSQDADNGSEFTPRSQLYSIFAVVFESDGTADAAPDEVRLYTEAGEIIEPHEESATAATLFLPNSERRVGDGLGSQFLLYTRCSKGHNMTSPETRPVILDPDPELTETWLKQARTALDAVTPRVPDSATQVSAPTPQAPLHTGASRKGLQDLRPQEDEDSSFQSSGGKPGGRGNSVSGDSDDDMAKLFFQHMQDISQPGGAGHNQYPSPGTASDLQTTLAPARPLQPVSAPRGAQYAQGPLSRRRPSLPSQEEEFRSDARDRGPRRKRSNRRGKQT